MGSYDKVATLEERVQIRDQLRAGKDYAFVTALPKVELHVHIEGTLETELRWEFAQRNGITLTSPRTGEVYTSLQHLLQEIDTFDFFEGYYGGFDVMVTTQDFYELAMNYFSKAAAMNVRYVEVFFDPQGHTRRGVEWDTFMRGFRQASVQALQDLNLRVNWIMCFLRDVSPESAMEHYLTAAEYYRDDIVGLGLDSVSYKLPPTLFERVWSRARKDGHFRLTAHCDDGAREDVLEHIREVCCVIGDGSGGDRIDHGISAADSPELIELIKHKSLGLTLCPCGYMRSQPEAVIFPKIRILHDAGVKFAIGVDDPAYLGDNGQVDNLLLVMDRCRFTRKEMANVALNSVDMIWASDEIKQSLRNEIRAVVDQHDQH